MKIVIQPFLVATLFGVAISAPAQTVATSNKAYQFQLSGAGADASGAAIVGAWDGGCGRRRLDLLAPYDCESNSCHVRPKSGKQCNAARGTR
jgi:hypothetical protein